MAKKAIPGWLYVLVNPAMPGLVKVGHTTRNPPMRAIEIGDATGVPCAFHVAWCKAVPNSEHQEGVVHGLLAPQRPSPNREFFFASVEEARAAIESAVAGKRPAKGELPPFAGRLPSGWQAPQAPSKRLPSDRMGQIKDGQPPALADLDDELDTWAEEVDLPELPPPARLPPPEKHGLLSRILGR